MKGIVLCLVIVGSFTCLGTAPADAFVCVRGFYRAGCVGPYGAFGVRRGYYGGGVYRGTVVRRGGVVVRRGVYRRY